MPHPVLKIRFQALLRYLGIIYCSQTKVRSKSFWTMMPQTRSSKFKEGGRHMLFSYHCWDNCNPCCAFLELLGSWRLWNTKKKKKKVFSSTLLTFSHFHYINHSSCSKIHSVNDFLPLRKKIQDLVSWWLQTSLDKPPVPNVVSIYCFGIYLSMPKFRCASSL